MCFFIALQNQFKSQGNQLIPDGPAEQSLVYQRMFEVVTLHQKMGELLTKLLCSACGWLGLSRGNEWDGGGCFRSQLGQVSTQRVHPVLARRPHMGAPRQLQMGTGQLTSGALIKYWRGWEEGCQPEYQITPVLV